MRDDHTDCDRFDQFLLDGGAELEPSVWGDHVAACASCRAQWQAHRMLAVAFAEQSVPELSPAFEAGLNRKLTSTVERRPLSGWRSAAMLVYVVAALATLRWALKDVPLPAVDLSSPWVMVAAFLTVPLTLMLAIAASRWIPSRGMPTGPGTLAV